MSLQMIVLITNIRVVITLDLSENSRFRSSGVQGRCRAVFSYQPANPDELPLCVGDVLEVLGEVNELIFAYWIRSLSETTTRTLFQLVSLLICISNYCDFRIIFLEFD